MLAADALAVDESAVPAAKVFEEVFVVNDSDLRLQPADPAVAEDKLVARLPSDAEGKRCDRHLAADAGGIEDENSGRSRHRCPCFPVENSRHARWHVEDARRADSAPMLGELAA